MKTTLITCLCAVMLNATAIADESQSSVKVSGDLRYRHEMIDEEGAQPRHRHRIRARVAVEGAVSPYTKVVVQMATGTEDPVSTNQTLSGSFSTKSLMLDLAYAEFKFAAVPKLSITGGKFKNPFIKPGKSELLWDDDWNPEGGAFNYNREIGRLTLTAVGAGLWIEERADDDDSWLAAGQIMLQHHSDHTNNSAFAGVGFFNYFNTAGFLPFFNPSRPMGNSVANRYVNEYELLQLFAGFTHYIGNVPVLVFGDYVNNTAIDSLGYGWLTGTRIGEINNVGSWAVRYIYRDVKKDAVVGTFTDSDFRGGGTDGRGHEINAAVQVADKAAVKATLFSNTINLSDRRLDYTRLQLDLQLKFK
ncbi:MAG: putative porin [bacterium]